MNRILILIAFLATPQLYADPYETAQRFTAGDVISAEVLNDILDRIELSLKEITVAELVGTWSATQHICKNTLGRKPGIAIDANLSNSSDDSLDQGYGCLWMTESSNYPGVTGWDSVTSMEDGLYGKRTDTMTITAVSGSDTKFTLQSENFNFTHRLSAPAGAAVVNQGVTHECAIIGGHGLFGCLSDAAVKPNINKVQRRDYFYYQMRRLSPTRFEILGGPERGGAEINLIIMDKTNIAPEAPTALSASVAGNASAATVTLSWTINGSTATGGGGET